jgi:hypothetical protein
MAKHQRKLRIAEFAIDDMEIGTADAAGPDLYQDLGRVGGWDGQTAED